MKTFMQNTLFLFIVTHLIVGGLTAADIFSQLDKDLNEEIKSQVPNPIDLSPHWGEYLDTNDQKELRNKITKLNQLLLTLTKNLDDEEDRQQAERLAKEISVNLESYILIQDQKVVVEPDPWLAKESYSLDEYIEIADKIHDTKSDTVKINNYLDHQENFLKEYQQQAHNRLAKYLDTPKNTKEKLLSGLQVIADLVRVKYLEKETRLTRRVVNANQAMIRKYEEQINHIRTNIDLSKINQADLRNKIIKTTNAYRNAHRELLFIESKAITENKQVDRSFLLYSLANKKILNALIKVQLYKSRLFFLESIEVLELVKDENNSQVWKEALQKLKDDYQISKTHLNTLRLASPVEIDSSVLTLLAKPKEGKGKEEEVINEEQVILSFKNAINLEKLSKELYHGEVMLGLIQSSIIEKQTFFEKIYLYGSAALESIHTFFSQWFFTSLFEVGGVPVTIISLLKAMLIITVAYWLSTTLRKTIRGFENGKGKVPDSTLYTVSRIVHYFVLITGVFIALASIGLTFRNLAIVLGALGIGIGLGLQGIVNNFLSGLSILFERNIKIGDFVELGSGQFGRVTDIRVQNTTIHTLDGIDIVLPNSSIVGNQLINWTKKDPYQRIHIPFGVAYGSDQDKVKEVVIKVAYEQPSTLYNKQGMSNPDVWLVEFGESSLNFELVLWVNIRTSGGPKHLTANYLSAIEKALKKNGIVIPFPQRDLHVKTLPR